MTENSSESQDLTRRRRESKNPSIKSKTGSEVKDLTLIVESDSDNEEDKSDLYLKKKNKVPGYFTLISVTILITLTLLFVKYMDNRLPKALMEIDIPNNPRSFIEARALRDLHSLTQVGVRVSGSTATDVVTVNGFLDILNEIKQNSSAHYDVQFEVQRPTGGFWLDDDEGSTSSYSKIANVVAKLEPSDPSKRTNDGILLNCHFDSKPGSPGATDDVISCSVMLEILRVLSTQPDLVIQNTLVLLFNGAEELGLQGAHGFVRGKTSPLDTEEGHPWSQNLKVFINLEGAGGGGREILFQATGGRTKQTGWLLEAYRECPHPYGTVLAEEAFQFGLIPSDTDFRIFRDFKDIPGLDIAYIKNGWVYHTKWDKVSEIPSGSLQHMGSNALAMVEYLGNKDFSKDPSSAKEMVFFDVVGGFMISYSKTVGIVINVLVALISIGIIVYFGGWKLKSFLLYAWYLGSTILAWGVSIGVAALIALMLNGSGYPKPFYSYPSLALVLYGLPAMITQILVYSVCLKGSPKDTWLAGKLTIAIILLVVTFITRAAYIFVPPLLFGIVGWFAARYLMRGWPRAIMVTYIIVGEVIPLIMSSYLIIILAEIFVPILGRSGSEMNGNLFFGLIIAAFTAFTVSGLVSLFVDYDKRILVTCLLVNVFFLNSMVVFGFVSPNGVPYQEKTPMRLTVCDVNRIWYHENGTEQNAELGYWFWPIDADTDNMFPLFSKTVTELETKNIKDENLDYENCKELYCSQPFIWPTTSRIKKVHWIPKNGSLPQNLRDNVGMNIHENTTVSPTLRRLTLEFMGPPQMTVILSPQKNWEAEISIQKLTDSIKVEREGSIKWQGRKVYYIYHGRGYEAEPMIINIELTQTSNSNGNDEVILDIQHTGLFLDLNSGTGTPEYLDFLSRFPSWSYTGMSWSSVVKIYKLY